MASLRQSVWSEKLFSLVRNTQGVSKIFKQTFKDDNACAVGHMSRGVN